MATTITYPLLIFLLIFYNLFNLSLCSDQEPVLIKGIDLAHPTIDVTPTPIHGLSQGSKDVQSCERVPIHGISRMKIQSYAKAFKVMLVPSVVIPDKWHNKIQICFHQNASMGLCQCEKDDWRTVHKGLWSSTMSPYEQRFVDVKFTGGMSGSVTVTLEEVSQEWRYVLLLVGIALLFLAPAVSNWVPFYYTSSMAIGILAVILILLYQGMKLLPTGRKSAFYLSMYTSLIGAGSFLVHYVAVFVNSILSNFGFSQEMQNPVSVFVLLTIILLGAALGYWLVRKYVISEDGDVDVGVAQFIKWSMRVIAVTCIFLSSNDTPLATAAVGSCLVLYYMITSLKWHDYEGPHLSMRSNRWRFNGQRTPKAGRAEFLSRPKKISPLGSPWNGPRNSFAWPDSPVKGTVNTSGDRGSTGSQHDYYSTYHKTPNRKKYSKEEWAEFTEESTRESVAELASTPEFTDWMIKNAKRIKLLPDNGSDDDASGSDSTDGYLVKKANRRGFFSW
ncbi:putative NEMP family protein [Helianthus annuus]|nr:putative NEMP family protein [Helianthus annuus]